MGFCGTGQPGKTSIGAYAVDEFLMLLILHSWCQMLFFSIPTVFAMACIIFCFSAILEDTYSACLPNCRHLSKCTPRKCGVGWNLISLEYTVIFGTHLASWLLVVKKLTSLFHVFNRSFHPLAHSTTVFTDYCASLVALSVSLLVDRTDTSSAKNALIVFCGNELARLLI